MLEFGARVLLAGAVVLGAGATGLVGLPLALGVALAVGLLALAAYALDERGQYDGAGAGLHAGLEGLAVSLLLTGAGRTESLGFLALAPYAWVAARRSAPWAPGACAAAFALVAAHALVHGQEPSAGLVLQAGGVLGLGLLLALRIEKPAGRDRRRRGPGAEGPVPRPARGVHVPGAARRGRRPRRRHRPRGDARGARPIVARCHGRDGGRPLRARRRRLGGARERRADSHGLEGPFPNGRALQERGAVLLFAAGRLVGAAWVPESVREGLASVAEALATRLADRLEAQSERRRRHAAETRLALVEGGDSPDAVARALAALVGADTVEFGAIGPLGATALGRFGPPCALPAALRHETGPGLDGWAAAGSPLVWIADARADERLDGATTLRARTAALALVPLANGRAYAWAAWHARGAGRPSSLVAIRASEGVVLRWMERATGREYGVAA